MNFPKYVMTNTNDLDMAIREAKNPMCEWYDANHDDLPYFENIVTGEQFGNYHHTSWSCGHCPGRWAESLFFSQLVTGMELDPVVFQKLKKWVFKVYSNHINLPANIDLNTFELKKEVDLCNLRESFFGLTAVYLYDHDIRVFTIAEKVIATVEKYFDFENGRWDSTAYEEATGAKSVGLFTGDLEQTRFCNTFGRFIGGLVRYYEISHSAAALTLACKLSDVALRSVVLEDGTFDPDRTSAHPYSTTSMLSGIALLADITGDMLLFNRLKSFMENGFYQIAIDTGWVTENLNRTNLVGEINNSCDLLEVCLFLGKAGFSKYYERAEQMLRGHILPSQLLDTCFISDKNYIDDSKNHMARRVKGAFGFPTPYGHEDEPGSVISYNWDIIGGVSGLCWSKCHQTTENNDIYSINLLFDYENHDIKFSSPYQHDDILSIKLRAKKNLRIRLSSRIDLKKLKEELKKSGIIYCILGDWLYLNHLMVGHTYSFCFPFIEEDKEYIFKNHHLTFRWKGDSIIAASSEGKRLCFFQELS